MKKNKTRIFTACPNKFEDSLLHKSLIEHDLLGITKYVDNNRKSLSVVFNMAIDEAIDDGVEYLVLCHDDITIESGNLESKIEQNMENYDVLGVAGTSTIELCKPALWHIMAEMGGGDRYCSVSHYCDVGGVRFKNGTSVCGSFPGRCVVLDGVFMVVSRRVFEKVRFDESNPSNFHFYDLDYTCSVNAAKFNMAVVDIFITHDSHGLSDLSDESWCSGQEWFLEKWSNSSSKCRDVTGVVRDIYKKNLR